MQVGIVTNKFLVARPPLWSSDQSSWLLIQGPGFDSRRYQIIWEVVSLERGPLSLVSTTEELLERKSIGFGLEIREYGHRDPPRWPRVSLYPQKLALSSPTSCLLLGRYGSLANSGDGVVYPNLMSLLPDTGGVLNVNTAGTSFIIAARLRSGKQKKFSCDL
jgi:hypothetical protein